MSDVSGLELDDSVKGAQVGGQDSAGALIRQAREQAGLHIGALAVSLKVPVKKLEALEGDRIEELPDIVFARALAATVCRILKVDPAPVLAALPHAMKITAGNQISLAKPAFRRTGNSPQKSIFERLTHPFMLLGVAFAFGALALILYSSIEPFFMESSGSSEIGIGSVPALVLKGSPGNSQPAVSPEKVTTTDAVLPAPVGFDGATGSFKALPEMASADPASKGTTVHSKSEPPGKLESHGILNLKSRGSSWVEVVDASRVTQLRKTMSDGESQAVSGTLPLSVTVGRADSIEVQVRGRTIDLTAFTKDNVARFEVK